MFKISEQEAATGPVGSSFFTNHALISPRISFSHDFVDTTRPELGSYKEAPVSSDFEFSVNNYTMIPADQVILKGVMVPSKEDMIPKPTLKDQLLVGDDDGDVSNDSSGWTGWWGLKKRYHHQYGSNRGGKRGASFDGVMLDAVVEEKPSNEEKKGT